MLSWNHNLSFQVNLFSRIQFCRFTTAKDAKKDIALLKESYSGLQFKEIAQVFKYI